MDNTQKPESLQSEWTDLGSTEDVLLKRIQEHELTIAKQKRCIKGMAITIRHLAASIIDVGAEKWALERQLGKLYEDGGE